MQDFINSEFSSIADYFQQLKNLSPQIEQVAKEWIAAYKRGNKILFCGNGGSAADAQHLAAELVGRYQLERPAMEALALTTDTSILTAVGNDYGYDCVFERQVAAMGKAGDVLVGISTSGNSPNVLRAVEEANKRGLLTVAFTGQGGGKLKDCATHLIDVPATQSNHIQEMHIAIGHLLCGITEKAIHE